MPAAVDPRPLVLHVVHRFDTGGLENGLLNLIDAMPSGAYRHAVAALTEITDFRGRLRRKDVEFVALHKPPGHGHRAWPRLWRELRRMRPSIVHTRNLGPLEMQPVAAAAGVAARIHGEHGREMDDLDGSNRRLQRVRRLYAPFVHRWVAVSRDLENYLTQSVGIASRRVSQIYNGVDDQRFRPDPTGTVPIAGCPFRPGEHWIVGTVGRMQGVKNQTLLARAFVRALEMHPAQRTRLRLVMIGDGPLRAEALEVLARAGVSDLAWLPGERSDVPDVMRGLDCFVLPSLAEGVSNTILEAMSTGVPVIATDVGGNAELVGHTASGWIVPSGDVEALSTAVLDALQDPAALARRARAARQVVLQRFSLTSMVGAYCRLYDQQLHRVGI